MYYFSNRLWHLSPGHNCECGFVKIAAFELSWLCMRIKKLCKCPRISSFKFHGSPNANLWCTMRVHFAVFFNYSWNFTNKMRPTISGPYIQWAKTTSTRARTSSENVILRFFNNFRLNFKYVLELNLNQGFIEKKTKRKISRPVLTLSTQRQSTSFHVVERTATTVKCIKMTTVKCIKMIL